MFSKAYLIVSSFIGLYTASNGYLVTEVIQFIRKFGQWQEDGETEGHPEAESCDYVEAVKLTGDPDVPAGQASYFLHKQKSLFIYHLIPCACVLLGMLSHIIFLAL